MYVCIVSMVDLMKVKLLFTNHQTQSESLECLNGTYRGTGSESFQLFN